MPPDLEIGRKPVLVERQAAGHLRESRRIDIVHEMQLGLALQRAVALVLERGQRLARQARAAAAHDDDMLELREAFGVRLQRLEIVAARRQLQERQRAVVLPLADLVERRRRASAQHRALSSDRPFLPTLDSSVSSIFWL